MKENICNSLWSFDLIRPREGFPSRVRKEQPFGGCPFHLHAHTSKPPLPILQVLSPNLVNKYLKVGLRKERKDYMLPWQQFRPLSTVANDAIHNETISYVAVFIPNPIVRIIIIKPIKNYKIFFESLSQADIRWNKSFRTPRNIFVKLTNKGLFVNVDENVFIITYVALEMKIREKRKRFFFFKMEMIFSALNSEKAKTCSLCS